MTTTLPTPTPADACAAPQDRLLEELQDACRLLLGARLVPAELVRLERAYAIVESVFERLVAREEHDFE